MKSTKQEIFDAYTEMKNRLDEINNMKDDPLTVEREAHLEQIDSAAKDIISQGILSKDIIDKYNNLCEAIQLKEERLKDIYGIEAEANSLVALINAHKDKIAELKARYELMAADMEKGFTEKKESLKAELDELTKQKKDIIDQTRAENDALKASLNTERQRENDEYEYNLARLRKIENDRWTDEKKAREKELSEREADVQKRADTLHEMESEIAELKQKVADIPKIVAEAEEAAKKAGKAEADKSHAFEVRSINTKNEYEQNSLKDQIDRLKEDLAAVRSANAEIQAKLDAAYAQMRDLAAETVKSNGSIKIINNDSSNKVTSK